VPRIMYMDFPFQIFQTPDHVAITFEWSQLFRLISTNGSAPPEGIDFWMGDSRGRWEGDTLVVQATNHNDRTWFDMAGDFHSDALRLVERYTLADPDTIRYAVTIEDPKVFTRAWTISMPLYRQKDLPRLLEYQCNAEMEEASGAFEREPRTWFAGLTTASPSVAPGQGRGDGSHPAGLAPIRRDADGKPNFAGTYMPEHRGANYGLERHAATPLTPGGEGVIVDPPDGKLPMQAWARAEVESRGKPERGYDDPTAHCFPASMAPVSGLTTRRRARNYRVAIGELRPD